jgi:hypothetical protein
LDSDEIDESDSQDEKYDDPKISTFRGISIDSDDDEEDEIACDSNVIFSISLCLHKHFPGKTGSDPGIDA